MSLQLLKIVRGTDSDLRWKREVDDGLESMDEAWEAAEADGPGVYEVRVRSGHGRPRFYQRFTVQPLSGCIRSCA
jgi:hypothetical protein